MRMDEIMRFKVENVKEALVSADNLRSEAMDRLNEVLPRERMKIVGEKASLALQNSAGEALVWFDEVFPPETRKEKINYWFHVSQLCLIAAMVVAVLLWFCRSCSKCILGTGRGSVKMMKAPGRAASKIPRAEFESNPKGYFSDLRANP